MLHTNDVFSSSFISPVSMVVEDTLGRFRGDLDLMGLELVSLVVQPATDYMTNRCIVL